MESKQARSSLEKAISILSPCFPPTLGNFSGVRDLRRTMRTSPKLFSDSPGNNGPNFFPRLCNKPERRPKLPPPSNNGEKGCEHGASTLWALRNLCCRE